MSISGKILVNFKVEEERDGRLLSVFNVVTFPNSACGATR